MKDHRITYGLSLSLNKLVSIEEVERGLKCNCICPDKRCKEPLEACKGKMRTYFRHKSKKDCLGGFESQWHLLSKEIISNNKSIMLPEYYEGGVYFPPESIQIESVQPEIFMHGRQPDLLCTFNDRNGVSQNLWIEILFSHAVDETKADEIREFQINCIEIDVRPFQNHEINKEELSYFILSMPYKRRWINCEYKKDDVKEIQIVKTEILTGKMDILEFVKHYSEDAKLRPLFGSVLFLLYQAKVNSNDFFVPIDERNKMFEFIANHFNHLSRLNEKETHYLVSCVQLLSFELIRWDKYDNRLYPNKQDGYFQCVERDNIIHKLEHFAKQVIQYLPTY